MLYLLLKITFKNSQISTYNYINTKEYTQSCVKKRLHLGEWIVYKGRWGLRKRYVRQKKDVSFSLP